MIRSVRAKARGLAATRLSALASAAVVAFAAAPATAATDFFSDLGPGGSSQTSTGWTVSGANSLAGTFTPAMAFTALASGAVTQIDMALSSALGSDPVTVSLWTDVDGALGTQIGSSWTVAPGGSLGSQNPLSVIGGITGVSLTAGDSYFLEAVANANDLEAWNWNSTGYDGAVLSNGVPQSGASGAFSVLGGVPEPATWAMMVVGVGLLGAGLRLSRSRDGARAAV